MLTLQRARLRPQIVKTVWSPNTRPAHRRFFVQSLCNGFLDLALALPIPPSLPTYSTTIIVVTLVTRLALLPISIWGQERSRRLEDIVIPEIEKLKPLVSKRVFEEMKVARVKGDKQTLQKLHTQKSVEVLQARQKELIKQHHCSPLPSILIPPISQLPVFIGFTYVLNRLSVAPTPLDSESFLTLTSLIHPDPTMTIPVILGFLTMANVESGNWVMNAAERQQKRANDAEEEKRIAAGGKPKVHPGNIIKSTLRGLSVLRIVVAAMAPGSIALYWVTSAAFGLVQTWFMEWTGARRRRRRLESQPSAKQGQPPGKR